MRSMITEYIILLLILIFERSPVSSKTFNLRSRDFLYVIFFHFSEK